jgi:hypothetical protein
VGVGEVLCDRDLGLRGCVGEEVLPVSGAWVHWYVFRGVFWGHSGCRGDLCAWEFVGFEVSGCVAGYLEKFLRDQEFLGK